VATYMLYTKEQLKLHPYTMSQRKEQHAKDIPITRQHRSLSRKPLTQATAADIGCDEEALDELIALADAYIQPVVSEGIPLIDDNDNNDKNNTLPLLQDNYDDIDIPLGTRARRAEFTVLPEHRASSRLPLPISSAQLGDGVHSAFGTLYNDKNDNAGGSLLLHGMTMRVDNPQYIQTTAVRDQLIHERDLRRRIGSSALASHVALNVRAALLDSRDTGVQIDTAERRVADALVAGIGLAWPPERASVRNATWRAALQRELDIIGRRVLDRAVFAEFHRLDISRRLRTEEAIVDAILSEARKKGIDDLAGLISALSKVRSSAEDGGGIQLTRDEEIAIIDTFVPTARRAELAKAAANNVYASDVAAAEKALDVPHISLNNKSVRDAIIVLVATLKDEVALTDFSEMPLLVSELHALYNEYANERARAIDSGNVLPFESAGVDEYDADFVEQTIVAYAIQPYVSEWFDQWKDVYVGAQQQQNNARERVAERLHLELGRFVSGTSNDADSWIPSEAAIVRERALLTWNHIAEQFQRVVFARFELFFGRNADAPGDLVVASRIFNPDLIARSVRYVRAQLQSAWVADTAALQMRAIDAQLVRLERTIEVPLEDERSVGSREGFVLNIEVLRRRLFTAEQQPINDDDDEEDAQLARNTGVEEGKEEEMQKNVYYEFWWHFRPGGIADAERVLAIHRSTILEAANVQHGERASDTLVVARGGINAGTSAYSEGAEAGEYVVIVKRFDANTKLELAAVRSYVAILRVFDRCIRDGGRFEVGAGVARVFGECQWVT